MKRILAGEVGKHIGKFATVAGFTQVIRDQGGIKFILLRDISGTVQVVVTKKAEEAVKVAQSLSLESVIAVSGLIKEEEQAPGGIELAAEKIEVLSAAESGLPMPIFEKGAQEEADQSIRLDWRWLDLRKPKNTLVFKVWTTLEEAFREYWIANGYLEIHSPKIIGAPSESGAEVFEVKYFENRAYLAQSPQFYKQMAMAAGLEKVFEVGPVFRAEPSFTSRHATEFTGYDAEMSYIESHYDIMAEEERAIVHAFQKIKEKHAGEIEKEFGKEAATPEIPFPKISMKEAKKILAGMGISGEKDGDLSSEEERAISEYMRKERGHEFVFVTEYPASVRPFYHMREESDPALTKSFDLLWSGLEITTGAQREHRYDKLILQAKEKGMKISAIQFYLNFFRYGCPPHGGYGMGPNRMIMKLLGMENVREAMFIYRGVKRFTP